MKLVQKSWWREKVFWETVFLYLLVLLVYHFTQKNLPLKEYSLMARQALIPMFGFYLVQRLSHKPLLSFQWLPSLLVGLSWLIVMPWLKHLSLTAIYRWNPRGELLFGVYLMLIFLVLQALCALVHSRGSRQISFVASLFLTLFTLAALVIPIMEIGHFLLYHVVISDSSIYAMQLTYPKEALGYLQSYISPVLLLAILMLILIIGFGLYYCCRRAQPVPFTKKAVVLIILLPVLLVYLTGSLSKKEFFFTAWKEVKSYRQAQALFTKDYDQRYQELKLNTATTLAQTDPGTVIVVIGESASRNYMQTYTSSFPYNDTPWLDSKRRDPDFIVYNNVYSCYNQTVEALIRACTEMSQYNDKKFNSSITLVDVAKKAGYQTYWLSAQGGVGQNDAPITMIMKTADQYESLAVSGKFSYDEDLVKRLKEVNTGAPVNKFIVIHLKGSHGPYQARYPEEAAKFDNNSLAGRYANSILYTDTVLQQIFDYAKKNLNLQAMLYFSDHGDNLEQGHGPDVRTFDTLRIPMFLYLSPEYQRTYPEKTALLKARADSYFTNDMIYNTVCGILNAPSNHYDEKEDFSSPTYHFTRDTLWTFKHTVPISEDPTT